MTVYSVCMSDHDALRCVTCSWASCVHIVCAKIFAWEKLVNLANRMPFLNVVPANYFLYNQLVGVHAAHSPVFYPPIGSD